MKEVERTMLKSIKMMCLYITVLLLLVACSKEKKNEAHSATKEITYLEQTYTIPADPQKILFLNAFESIEDAVSLGVTPYAASAVGSDDEPFPSFFGDVTKDTIPLLGTSDESLEYVLELAPDLIISTDMEDPKVTKQLEKIAPVIPTSHFGPDWEKNLLMLGQVTNTEAKAETLIATYNQDKKEAVTHLKQFKAQEVLAVRLRGGEMMIYPKDVFLNDVLYGELGLTIPSVVENVTQQTVLTLEGLVSANPDYLFLQFDEYENAMQENVLNELQESEVWKGLKAVKNNHVWINAVDPLVTGGGTLNGRVRILEAAREAIQ